MRALALKILRLVLHVLYRERGSIVNRWGSITSPRELEIQRSALLGERSRNLVAYLMPTILEMDELKRYGSVADGGYVIPIKTVNNSNFLISGGIASNNDFEIELAKLGIIGTQVDNSIDFPPQAHENLSFTRATLGGKDGLRIDEILKSFNPTLQGLLKLDIEGAEYETLSEVESFEKFTTIIIELHNLHRIVDDQFWKLFKTILEKFSQSHSVVFLTPNNYSGFSIIGGVPIPNVLEVTWARNDLISGKRFKKIQTLHSEQMPTNHKNRAQLDISNIFPSESL